MGEEGPLDRINIPRLVCRYYAEHPDPRVPEQRVVFGTSGHRGSSLSASFNEAHVLAISEAVCRHRAERGIVGPLFVGMDTHALSEAALSTAIEVFAAHGVEVRVQEGLRYTPTPVISHAILSHNRGRTSDLADGIVITPSHNPPEDGGFKYNPPTGGPADPGTTDSIAAGANRILEEGLAAVRRIPLTRALSVPTTRFHDYVTPYVEDLAQVVDMEAVAAAGLSIGADPLGGSSLEFWGAIADRYRLPLTVINPLVDPTFAFMPPDWDGKIRMDCSSPYAMAKLIEVKNQFDIAFGNDPDADRHGIVARSTGLLNPNHFLAAAVSYLLQHRPRWRTDLAIGKTLVSSSMIDRVVRHHGRRLAEMPVGFKWFVDGLLDGSLAFGCEESAGASFLRQDGTTWTTDKDGMLMGLLACEMTARTGKDPGELYRELEESLGHAVYRRIDAPATPEQKKALTELSPEVVTAKELAGDPIVAKLTRAPGNGVPIEGLKVVTAQGWFAVRPSGTESVFKLYAESFRGEHHLEQILAEAQVIIDAALQ